MTLLTITQVAKEMGLTPRYTSQLIKEFPHLYTTFGTRQFAIESRHVPEFKRLVSERKEEHRQERIKRGKEEAAERNRLMVDARAKRKQAAEFAASKALGETALSLSAASHALDLSESKVLTLVQSNKLRGIKSGSFWFVGAKKVEEIVAKKFPPPPQAGKPATLPKEVTTLAMQLLAVTGKTCTLSGNDITADTVKALTKVGEEYSTLKAQNEQLRKQLSEKPHTNEELVKLCTQQAQDVANANNQLMFHKQLTCAAMDLITESDKNQSQAMIRERLALRRVLEWMGEVKKRA